jgi:serine protease Do
MIEMKSEIEIITLTEAYYRAELSIEERMAFEKMREDPEIDSQVVSHHNLMKQISEYGNYQYLRADMETIHDQLDVDSLMDELIPAETKIRTLWRKNRINAAVAASVAILAACLTVLSSGYFNGSTTDPNYNYLNRKVDNIVRSQQQINQKINSSSIEIENPSRFAATGFALSTNGYIMTNYHVVNGADSIYVQNFDGESFKANVIYTDVIYDIAILLIKDNNFTPFTSLPYTIKKSGSEMGDEVYTLGYPRDTPVYTKGYISAQTGYKDGISDTTTYQVTLPVNPGNSGGPVLDSRGNIIGIVSAKQKQVEGATFAIKSEYLVKSIQTMQDSLDHSLVLNKKNSLSGLNKTDQVKKMKKYIFMVKSY